MRNRKAFTLVELLVVIGIIALLISILLPVISRANRQAKQTATLTALRQIGLAVSIYQQEHRGAYPTNPTSADPDGRAFHGLAMLASMQKLPTKLFINPNTDDTPATAVDANGWPALVELDGAAVTPMVPVTIDASNIGRVVWHVSFAYDHEPKAGRRSPVRVYLGDRADYAKGRSFSANWEGRGMCLLWTDQHGEFVTNKAIRDQNDPNIYHHNEFLDENGVYPGEGGAETWDGVAVTTATLDTHLRVFSEEEDDALLPND